MEFTKKLEEEILKAYHAYWDAYLAGDMETFASLLDDDCHIIGSTAHDVFNNKKDAIAFYTATASEVTGKGKYLNRNISVLPLEDDVMVQELFDYYFLDNDEWRFYGQARTSTLFSKKKDGWKIVHQHGSLPDARADEGQQLGTEKITKENLQLKEAIKRNTIELQHKNRELEIETALEKVRAVAMGMIKPDDLLDICEVMFTELKKLGFDDLRNAMINIHYDDQSYLLNYDYAIRSGKTVTTFKYHSHHIVDSIVNHASQSKETFTEMIYSGDALNELRAFRKRNGEEDDGRLDEVDALCYYFYATGTGALGISMYQTANKEQLDILKRFRNVFDLAYKRYVDISNAEAQAREAQIEAALERIRAAAMAMHTSAELEEVANILREQMGLLGQPELETCVVNLHDDDSDFIQGWSAYREPGSSGKINNSTASFRKDSSELSREMISMINAGKREFTIEASGKKLEEFAAVLSAADPKIPAGLATKLPAKVYYYFAAFTGGSLLAVSYKPPSAETIVLQKRAAAVFDLAYRRYLDLKKAEAQAREAQVEAALEKVRSRSLAMHKSDELQDVVNTVFERLQSLNIEMNVASIFIFKEDSKDWQQWVASSNTHYSTHFLIPYTDNIIFRDLEEARENNKDFYSVCYSFEEKNAWFSYAFANTEYSRIPDARKKFLLESPFYQVSFALAKKTGIQLAKYSGNDFTDQDKEILQRFSRVFEQAYIRFLDLQKAEAQAKEAEVQLALERVRARTMAMHKSDELAAVASVLFFQLQELKLHNIRRCLIGIVDETNNKLQSWHTSLHGDTTHKVITYPLDEHAVIREKINGWKNQQPFSIDLTPTDLKDFIQYIVAHGFEYNDGEIPATKLIQNHAPFKYGYIELATHETISTEDFQLLQRFAKVFEQTYTRFLDLQKAEAQVREAQIEAALEKVRSRTMAMQKSGELLETAELLFQQVKDLGCSPFSCGFVLLDRNKTDGEFFMSAEGKPQQSVFIPNGDESAERNMYLHWEKGARFYMEDGEGEELVKHFEYLMSLPGENGAMFRAMHDAGIRFPTWQRWNAAFFSQGYLLFITREPFEETSLFTRFASIFEQTYTRFLDLQKAEKQGREADIELGLERVRAKTMAMQKSADLKEVVQTLSTEIRRLDLIFTRTSIVIYDPESLAATWWMSNPETNEAFGVFVKYHSLTPYLAHIDAWRERRKSWQYILEGDDKKHWDQFLFYETDLSQLPELVKQDMQHNEKVYLSCSFSNFGYLVLESAQSISTDQFDILSRFSKVFDQTYTRFLDLQKAEAQTREAEIELALERVRARTMSMQKSDELPETSFLLFEQLKHLGEVADQITIGVFNEQESKVEISATIMGSKVSKTYKAYLDEPYVMKPLLNAWKGGEKSLIIRLAGKKLESYNKYRSEVFIANNEAPKIPVTDHWIIHSVFFSKGFLSFGADKERPKESILLLERFATVFDLTYTRFLDLQHAEIRTKEAQIELGLERVRASGMAMQKSQELQDVIKVVGDQLHALDIAYHSALFLRVLEDGSWNAWITAPGQPYPTQVDVPYFDTPAMTVVNKAWVQGGEELTVVNTKKQKNAFFQFFFSHTAAKNIPEARKEYILNSPAWVRSLFFMKDITLVVTTFTETPFTEEENAIFRRFKNVFQQTYTRFLDLQKAEAQAREAQIEAALEKVRSRSLAMHKADELKEVVLVLVEKLQELGVVLDANGVVLCTYFKNSRNVLHWIASPDFSFAGSYLLPYFDHPIFKQAWESKESGDEYFSKAFSVEEKNSFFEYAFEHSVYKYFPDEFKQWVFQNDKHILSFAWQKNSAILIPSHTGIVPTTDEIEILKRFARVFEQAYIRFMDLEKAETQAREAQIEAALERVRSRSMAMHHTAELQEVIKTVYDQLNSLHIDITGGVFIAINEENKKELSCWGAGNTADYLELVHIPFYDRPIYKDLLDAIQKGPGLYTQAYTHEEKVELFKHLLTILPYNEASPEHKKEIMSRQGGYTRSAAVSKHACIFMINHHGRKFTAEENNILVRFGKVFEQSYTRFLDLQKSETQARESQIQLALERVRARTMAMHNSEELLDVILVVSEQLQQLDIPFRNVSFGVNNQEYDLQLWMAVKGYPKALRIQWTYIDNPGITGLKKAQQNPDVVYSDIVSEEDNKEWLQHIFNCNPTLEIFTEENKAMLLATPGYARSIVVMKEIFLVMGNYLVLPYTTEQNIILQRFGAVFEQSYTRFLDLQKAELQVRESQIQLALERVRARTMAMQKSEELQEVVHTLFIRLKELDIEFYTAIIIIFSEDSKDITWWLENKEKQQYSKTLVPYTDIMYLRDLMDTRNNGRDYFTKTYSFNEKNELFQHLFSATDFKHVSEKQQKFLLKTDAATMSVAIAKNTGIHLTRYNDKSFSEADNDILKRFSKVFDQAYTRFLDLQKAEAQAREAFIESALEKVRSRSIGMQKSEELKEVIQVVFEQFIHLHINVDHAGFVVDYHPKGDWHFWIADKNEIPSKITHPYFNAIWAQQFDEAKEQGRDFFDTNLNFEEKNTFYTELLSYVPGLTEEAKAFYFSCAGLGASTVIMNDVALYIENFSGLHYSDEENNILRRFGKVFQQTYTRFLDLQKAEAQAREAKIEAALEKVRSRSLAMHKSDELPATVKVMFEEFRNLQLDEEIKNVSRAFVTTIEEQKGQFNLWVTDLGGNEIHQQFKIDFDEQTTGKAIYKAWKDKQAFFVNDLQGEKLKQWLDYLKSVNFTVDPALYGTRRINNFIYYSKGFIGITSSSAISGENLQILMRFAKTFDQAYTRFLDLQKAEAQAREAQIEAALEKVRSKTLSMQRSDELADTSAVLFQQLIGLGISPNRLYIAILKDEKGNAEFWITDEDGTKVSMAYEDNLNNHPVFKQMLDGWEQQQKSLVIDMEGDVLQHYLQYLQSIHVPFHSGLEQRRRLQYLAYFSKGFIGMASPDEQPPETLKLLERFAYVFNLTFTRFHDLQIAEAHAIKAEQDLVEIKAARKNAEAALAELQATQKQLIQSEKMASLGELTAGIAHEIQNPLNFVNNFSEVSNELLDDIMKEVEKGNYDEVKLIVEDIKQNLEKINHHGKRADGIVKGMLQHSRTSTGQKEQTNINTLCDEYLRLAYHGLRAKDKTFNAELKTDFDDTISKLAIVPQEIGRVLLNLVNNAFYAVNEKSKQGVTGYQPTVNVSTKKLIDTIEISVKDNGNGIPNHIKEKIFQPFFTTKPTGSGTGLGLSLSYDIIKTHGGEIRVETKESEFTEFTIELPIKTGLN